MIWWIITTSARTRRPLLSTNNNMTVSHTHDVRNLRCNDAQRERRRPLRLGVSVQLTGTTSQIPQVRASFLHMLDPLYTTLFPPPQPPSHIFTSKPKVSKNVFGTSRQSPAALPLYIWHGMEPAPSPVVSMLGPVYSLIFNLTLLPFACYKDLIQRSLSLISLCYRLLCRQIEAPFLCVHKMNKLKARWEVISAYLLARFSC
jgi:hypothetical protein